MKIRNILFALTLSVSGWVMAGTISVERDYKYTNDVTADKPYKLVKNGILLVDNVPTVRAMESYGGSVAAVQRYAGVANAYKKALGDSVNVYCMPIPTAVAYYAPSGASSHAQRVRPRILDMFEALDKDVVAVDVYPELGRHADEPIYMRTDHHWGALGAYYAASRLADVAGVPFADLSRFERHEVPGYVGTMARFSGSDLVKQSPETFYYYTPADTSYTTIVTDLQMNDKHNRVVGVKPPRETQYFAKATGSASYGKFGGGDYRIIKVKTGLGNGRRVAIIKDSYGNALAPFLFGSFEEVHVIDGRYFPYNIVEYVRDNGITDMVLCNNLLLAGSLNTANNLKSYLLK